MIDCVSDRLPLVRTVKTRSPTRTKVCILRQTLIWSYPALVRESDAMTSPRRVMIPRPYVTPPPPLSRAVPAPHSSYGPPRPPPPRPRACPPPRTHAHPVPALHTPVPGGHAPAPRPRADRARAAGRGVPRPVRESLRAGHGPRRHAAALERHAGRGRRGA